MEVSANVRRTEPTPRREQDGETYSAATRSRSTSTQPIAAPSTATHTSCSRIARATRSAAPRVAHLSACSLDIAGTASARIARRRMLASASSSAASARRICIKSLPRSLTPRSAAGREHHACDVLVVVERDDCGGLWGDLPQELQTLAVLWPDEGDTG